MQTINVYDRVQRKLVERITLNEALARLQPRYGNPDYIAEDLADGVTFRIGQIVYRALNENN